MTDFNTNTETNIEATAVETTTEASTEAKAAKEITTAKHARFLAEAARKRAEKFRTQATEADETAAKYDELAATLPEGTAAGAEWRTAPLWGIGTTGRTRFLHDGRARNLTEAILWHDGEARRARQRFERLHPGDRAAVLRFIQSL